ncbi:protein of unknown function [Tenacibaculum mesophilum]|uniref:DUF4153 domain-containing protein n=1 Tax=Tenacibaculum mesophilum TaxID=104268 RepID=A0ABM7CGX6_9FLAO|nr:DUF4153 domain-containing protein [Tenacibaculum mesophilum]AZJ33058.1 DUF4153 domain-containing protein [Tenacibaculum mesophilum]QFS28309.1 DUF4153 domain-containing protein [Tenacibaculum mesophilum]SHF68305.1 protein of unknown function [Tenacibaculum mesophilum]
MKIISSLGEITSRAKNTFKRFPITLFWAIVGTLFTLFTIETNTFDSVFYGKVILIFILGVSWLIATRFFEEQFKKDKTWIFLLTLGFLSLFYISIEVDGFEIHQNSIIRFVLYFITGHLLVMVTPFIFSWNKSAYFNYLKSLFIALVRSLFFSLVLYLGIVLALLAIKHLFAIDFKGERFFQVFVFCIGIINTWIYLSDFPKDVHNQLAINYTKALEVLVKYILIPLVILYLIILYAYSLKIVINWNLPKGWVSYLVIALSFLGFIVQILINPIQKTINSRTIKKFYPWFYYLLLPLIVLLFVAIFRRINEYGITENRYFVFVLACWILAMCLYILFSKRKKIKIFPFSLALITFLVSFGFWGVFSVSTKSQLLRFEKVYTDIKKDNFSTTFEKKNQLRSIIRYLNNKHELHKVKNILGYNPKTTFKTDSRWQLQNRLMDSLDIKVTDNVTHPYTNHYYSIDENNAINIKNYDILKKLYINRYKKQNSINGYHFSLSKESNIVEITKNEILIGKVNCSEMIKKLKAQQKNHNISPNLMTIEQHFKTLSVKFIFKSISLSKIDDGATENYLSNADIYALIKEKNAE